MHSKGYVEFKTDYSTDGHLVWKDSTDRIIDLHFFEFEGIEMLLFEGEAYPADALNGEGVIGETAVKCFTAEAQLLFHQGYEHGENDVHDVLLLCKTFGFDIPDEYESGGQ